MDVLELDSSDGATTLNRLQTTLVGGPKRMLLTGAHRTCQALSVPSTITRQRPHCGALSTKRSLSHCWTGARTPTTVAPLAWPNLRTHGPTLRRPTWGLAAALTWGFQEVPGG